MSSDSSQNLKQIKRNIKNSNLKGNENLKSREKLFDGANDFTSCATKYDEAVRIKNDDLYSRNEDQNGWPGQRTDFEIDRDQILYNPNFVRLARKTQVFIGQKNVQFKNRLIHTLEVVQLAKSVAQRWCLNVDLAEAIAYGHDIGHAPFGHSGEEALNLCALEYFLRRYGLGISDLNPPKIDFDRSFYLDSHRDSVIWHLTNSIFCNRNKDLAPAITEVEGQLGPESYKHLVEKNIIYEDSYNNQGICYLNYPNLWEIESSGKKILADEFWLNEFNSSLFTHCIHSIRVLLADFSRPRSDLTYQTAYGILAHSWQKGFEKLTVQLFKGKSIEFQKKDHESPEAFVVRLADDICFTNSDLSDIRASSLLGFEEEFMKKVWDLVDNDGYIKDYPQGSHIIRNLEDGFNFSSGFSKQGSNQCYDDRKKEAIDGVRAMIKSLVHPKLSSRQVTAKKIVRHLFWFFLCPKSNPRDFEEKIVSRFNNYSKSVYEPDIDHSTVRKVIDYLAYLTDDEAIAIHSALHSPEQAQWASYFLDLKFE